MITLKPPVFDFNIEAEETKGLVQGIEPDSIEEWRVAKALDRLQIPYQFQFEIFDASVRGGIILDFLVHTVPLATPLEVDGQHWHSGERGSEDIMRHVILEDYFQGKAMPLEILYAKDLQDEDITYSAVRRAILNA